jgi:hypothetical protein
VAEPMSDARLAELDAWIGPSSLRGQITAKGSEAQMAVELVLEVKRLRNELAMQEVNLRIKWGQEFAVRLNELAPEVMQLSAARIRELERMYEQAISEVQELRAVVRRIRQAAGQRVER